MEEEARSAPLASLRTALALMSAGKAPPPQLGPSSRVSCMMNKNMKLVLCQKNNP